MADEFADITDYSDRTTPVLLYLPRLCVQQDEKVIFRYRDYASNADKYYLDGEVDDGVIDVDTSEVGSFEYDIKVENSYSGLTAEGTLYVDVVESDGDTVVHQVQIEYSADGNAPWGTTFTEGTHKYIRFSTDGGDTWSPGRRFVGNDGTSESIEDVVKVYKDNTAYTMGEYVVDSTPLLYRTTAAIPNTNTTDPEDNSDFERLGRVLEAGHRIEFDTTDDTLTVNAIDQVIVDDNFPTTNPADGTILIFNADQSTFTSGKTVRNEADDADVTSAGARDLFKFFATGTKWIRQYEGGVADAEAGEDAPEVQIQFSPDGSSSWGTFTAGDKYIRFSTDGGTTWSTGIKFVGDDGADGATGATGPAGATGATGATGSDGTNAPQVQIQFSPDGTSSWGSFEAGDEYIRFSVDGGTTWTTGIKFVGEDGEDGDDGGAGDGAQGRYQIFIYRNQALEGAPPSTPTGGAWDIEDAELDTAPTGWAGSPTTPGNATRQWRSSAMIDPSTQSGVVTPAWRQPVPMNGLPGEFLVYVYQNAATVPADPVGGTYDIANHNFSVEPSGWSESPSTPTGNERTWRSQAEIVPAGAGDYSSQTLDLADRWEDPIPISGRDGEDGTDGTAGADGDNAPQIQIQYSADGTSSWSATFTEGTHKYIRFSVDDGSTWSSARKFVGDDGEDGDAGTNAPQVQIQYSEDGTGSWGTTFTEGSSKYIRFSVDGGNTWTSGFKFVGDDGEDGEDSPISDVQAPSNRRGDLIATSSSLPTDVPDEGNVFNGITWTIESGSHSGLTTSGWSLFHTQGYVTDNPNHLGFIAVAEVDGNERGEGLILFGPGGVHGTDTEQKRVHVNIESDPTGFVTPDSVDLGYQARGNFGNDPLYSMRVFSNGQDLPANTVIKIYEFFNGNARADIPVPATTDDGKALIANDDETASWKDFSAPTAPTEDDDGKVWTASHDGTTASQDWEDAPSGLPDIDNADDGKILEASHDGTDGSADWADKPRGIPDSVGADDEGKALVAGSNDNESSFRDILAEANADLIWEAGSTWGHRRAPEDYTTLNLISGKQFSDYQLIVFFYDRGNWFGILSEWTIRAAWQAFSQSTDGIVAADDDTGRSYNSDDPYHLITCSIQGGEAQAHFIWVSNTSFSFKGDERSSTNHIGLRKVYGLRSVP